MTNAFKQWMIETYETEELRDIAEHGCAGGVGCMIYYTETVALYKRFSEELHEIVGTYQSDTGTLPKYITDELGDFVRFANAVVWFCAEYVAYELANSAE